jgi:hypothetical protein
MADVAIEPLMNGLRNPEKSFYPSLKAMINTTTTKKRIGQHSTCETLKCGRRIVSNEQFDLIVYLHFSNIFHLERREDSFFGHLYSSVV